MVGTYPWRRYTWGGGAGTEPVSFSEADGRPSVQWSVSDTFLRRGGEEQSVQASLDLCPEPCLVLLSILNPVLLSRCLPGYLGTPQGHGCAAQRANLNPVMLSPLNYKKDQRTESEPSMSLALLCFAACPELCVCVQMPARVPWDSTVGVQPYGKVQEQQDWGLLPC
jgi:hypothetical protein